MIIRRVVVPLCRRVIDRRMRRHVPEVVVLGLIGTVRESRVFFTLPATY